MALSIKMKNSRAQGLAVTVDYDGVRAQIGCQRNPLFGGQAPPLFHGFSNTRRDIGEFVLQSAFTRIGPGEQK